MCRSHQQGHSLSLISVLGHLELLREQVLSRLFDYSLDTRYIQQDPLQNPKKQDFRTNTFIYTGTVLYELV